MGGLGEPLYAYRRIGSTNDRLAELAREGSPHGTLVVADEQTAGRGRMGRRWQTRPGGGLAVSLLLRSVPDERRALGALQLLGALAVVKALEALGAPAEIKWPNDVILPRGKAAGVLVEGSWVGDELEYLILGIGVNIRAKSLPPPGEVDYPAACAEEAIGRRVDREALLLEMMANLAEDLAAVGTDRFLQDCERRLAFLDRPVAVSAPELRLTGRIQGLAEDGRLRLLRPTGEVILIGGGGVQLRPVDRGD